MRLDRWSDTDVHLMLITLLSTTNISLSFDFFSSIWMIWSKYFVSNSILTHDTVSSGHSIQYFCEFAHQLANCQHYISICFSHSRHQNEFLILIRQQELEYITVKWDVWSVQAESNICDLTDIKLLLLWIWYYIYIV